MYNRITKKLYLLVRLLIISKFSENVIGKYVVFKCNIQKKKIKRYARLKDKSGANHSVYKLSLQNELYC